MRVTAFLSAAALAACPAGLAAQAAFEGAITMKAGITSGKPVETHLWVKGSRVRIEMNAPMLGQVAFLVDDRSVTRVMDATKSYMVLPGGALSTVKYVPTGKHDTVAGYGCDYYKVQGGREKNEQACITSSLGFVGFGPGGPMGAADQAALRTQFKGGFLVLKTVTGDGTTRAEVIKVEKGPVSDARVKVPAGYSEMKRP